MTSEKILERLCEEQREFDQHVLEYLAEHGGQFVLFKGGVPIEFFEDRVSAFREGLSRFGSGGGFLVTEVKERPVEPVSISWQSGAMFELRS